MQIERFLDFHLVPTLLRGNAGVTLSVTKLESTIERKSP
jgi:hypothetical protein